MKRLFIFLLVLIMTLSLVSCKKMPESIILLGRNNDQMLEAASGNEEEKSVAKMLHVPERMILSVTDEKGNISVNVDANILLPDVDRIPIVQVHARDFTQEEADNILGYFIGEAAFDDRFEAGYSSEEEKLMGWMEELARETDPNKREIIQLSIHKFKSAGIVVPDTPHEILPASKVFVPTEQGAAKITGYSRNGENHKYLSILNHLDENKNILLYTCEQKGYADIGHEANYYSEASKGNLEKLGLGAAEQVPLTISSEDAKDKATEALQALNISDMQLYSLEEVWGGTFLRSNNGIAKQQEHHAYRLEFVRSLEGVPLTYTKNNINRSMVQIDERTGERIAVGWSYERVMFIIDDEGIIEFLWESPYKVVEQVTSHTKLIPFEDIESIFSTMILVTHAPYGQYGGGVELSLNIDEVELGMMRIQDKNGPGTGLIVPVWDFFGTMTLGGEELLKEHTSYLTINAIDGSIINRAQGY